MSRLTPLIYFKYCPVPCSPPLRHDTFFPSLTLSSSLPQPSQSLNLGLITFHLLVLLYPSIFCWRNSSPAPPSSSQPVLRFDFSVCSVNRVHQSHRRSGFVSSIWVLGLFVDADLSFCHRVSMSIWVLLLGFSRMVCFAKNCERPPEFAGFQSFWLSTNIMALF